MISATLSLIVSACGRLGVDVYQTPTAAIPIVPASKNEGLDSKSDSLGEVYFWLSRSASDPSDPSQRMISLVRLPGSCIVGLTDCPSLEEIETPFDIQNEGPTPFTAWSPDGNMAVIPGFSQVDPSSTGVYLYVPHQNTWKELTHFKVVDYAIWSPDSDWIAMRVQDGLGNVDVFVIRPDGSGLRNLTDINLPDQGEPSFLTLQSWLNGNVIIGTRGISDAEVPVFYFVDPPTGRIQNTFDLSTYAIFVSPDDSLVAVKGISPHDSSLDFINQDGTTSYSILSLKDSWVMNLNWSKDGEKMAYLVSSNAWDNLSRVIVVANQDGTHLTQYPIDKTLISLMFSPGGKYLLSDDHDSLYVLNLDTSKIGRFSGLPAD
ncbi:MAG TPA: hypothetical protein VK249_27205 [Anaerolineales bacterium]|nr:hypothetical protein [Anaerolineales bacterium]